MVLPTQETISIEFKSDKKCLPDEVILDSVVALANTDGGHFYLGVENDGTPTGVHKSHRDVTRLAAYLANNTVPPIATRVNVHFDESDRLQVIEIEVPQSTTVEATAQGKILRRRLKQDGTPETVPMYPYEIATRLSALDKLDYSALPAMGACLEDLDPNEIARLREIVAGATYSDKTLLELDDDQLLNALRLISDEDGEYVPNVAGLLLLGKPRVLESVMPTYGVAFQVLTGTTTRVNREIVHPILHAVQEIDALFEAWNPEREYFQGFFRTSVPEFDRRAFREAIVNAFGHRDYSRLGRVLVQVTDEGMTISNPGGFIEGVTIDNLLTVEPHGRNPRLMAALKRIGLAESTGRGVDRIFEGSLLFGRPLPDWSESSTTRVRLFIARSAPDEMFMNLLEEERQRTGVTPSLRQMMILDTLKRLRRCSAQELSDLLPMSVPVVKSVVEQLVEAGIVEAVGSNRNREYILSSRVYAMESGAAAHTLQADIDAIRYEELIVKLAQRQGSVANRDVVEMLHVGSKDAYRLLKNLVDSGRLTLQGKGAGARYRIAGSETSTGERS